MSDKKIEWTPEQHAELAEIQAKARAAQAAAREAKKRREAEAAERKVVPIKPAVAEMLARSRKVTEGLEVKSGPKGRRIGDPWKPGSEPEVDLNEIGLGDRGDWRSKAGDWKEKDEAGPDPEESENYPDEDDEGAPGKKRDPLWRARSALKYIVPTEDNFLRVGRALHSTGEETAFRLWLGWAKIQKDGEEAARIQWGKFDTASPSNRPISIRTVYWLAEREGWRWPIIFSANKLDRIAESAERALCRARAEIYQRGAVLLRPVIEEVEATEGRKARIAQLKPVSNAYMLGELSRYIDWHKVDEKKGLIPTGPNDSLAKLILGRVGRWGFRRVAGVLMTPTLRPDGSLLIEAGYDVATKLILMEPPAMPAMPVNPTKADAERAAGELDDLVVECPFENKPSRSVALSGLMTPVVRAALGCVPLHAATAPAASTGKSFLQELAAAIALGQPCPLVPAGRDPTEFEKRFNSLLMSGTSMLSIDNMTSGLKGDFLCQAVTSHVYLPRILGKSEIVRLVNGWTLFANGNNLEVERDMTRRTLLGKMDAKMERPEFREFQKDPIAIVLANRGKYVAAVLTIVRAYIVAGKPDCPPPIANFAAWSNLVRGSLMWLGYADPVESMESARDADPHLKNRQHIFQALADTYGMGEAVARSSHEMARDANDGMIMPPRSTNPQEARCSEAAKRLKEALMPVAGVGNNLNSNRIGYWLRQNRSLITRGMLLCAKEDKAAVVNRWWVENV